MRSYEAARNLFSFLGSCAWLVIIGGVVIAFLAGDAVSNGGFGGSPSGLQIAIAALPGAMMALAGFFVLAMVQIGRTSVDTAEYTQQSLDVSRQHLEVSKQLLDQGKTMAASYAALQPAKAPQQAREPGASANKGATYANQTKTSPASPMPVAAKLAVPKTSSSTPASIQKQSPPLLEPVLKEIVYKDGKYFVEGRRFWSREEATKYCKDLVATDTTRPS